MTRLDAVIFDLDGVLVHTIDMHEQAWHEVAQSGGRDFPASDMEKLRGLRRDECLQILFPDTILSPEKVDYLLNIKNGAYTDALFQRKPQELLDNYALDLLHTIRELGLKLGVPSSSVNAALVLEHVGIASLFDRIAGGTTVQRSKPKPDIFLWVAGALGVYPQHVLVFEDSVAGVTGAKQAGMHVVGIANPLTRNHADTYFDDLNIPFEKLLETLSLTLPRQSTLIGDTDVRD